MSLIHKWIDWDNFDVNKAEHFQSIENGDLNWILEKKFLAFAGPATDCLDEDGLEVLPPSHYAPLFKSFGVTDIVRLNIANYEPDEFNSHGINHHDLFFEDGSCPPMHILKKFLDSVSTVSGAVAVHCKAGLGRSVTLIGAHVMKTYQVPAKSFIGWARIARPGAVIGPQQHFLVEMQSFLWDRPGRPISRTLKALGSDSQIGKNGDEGQAGRLLKQKRRASLKPFTLRPAVEQV